MKPNKNYLEERRNNKKYWAKRSIIKTERFIEDAEKVAMELETGYLESARIINQEIRRIFSAFENAFDLSQAEAKRLIDRSGNKPPSKAILQILSGITDPEKKLALEAKISAPAYKYRLDRLDKLNKQAKDLCKGLYGLEYATDSAFLATEMEKAYNYTIFDLQQGTGISGAFDVLPKSRIEQTLKTNWRGKHFSSRIWGNTQTLADELRQSMIQSFITGESERKAAARIQERFNVSAYEARRLIRTENTYVTGQAELEAYKASGVDKYEYASLIDDRTSLICERLDGQVYEVAKAKPGVNYPPMHPFCRSSAMAVLPTEEELDKEWDTFVGDNVPQDMTFDEWLDKLEPTEDGKLVFKQKTVDKSAESGIIKSKDVKELEQAKKRDHKIYVTDVAIDKVDKVSLSDFSEEQILALQRKHKELLKIAKDENGSNEVLLINDLEFKSEVSVLGGEFKVSPGENPFAVSVISNAKRQSLIYLHNHPSTNNFSVGDIDTFVCESAIKTMSVVTNQGEVYVLNKTAAYNYNNIRTLLNEIYKSFDGDEIDNKAFVSEFLKRCKEGGVEYGKAK